MSPATKRIIGIIFMVIAAGLLILSLKRVANLGSYWVAMPLLTIGVILVDRSRNPG
jgi:hypothetical protein